MPYQQGALDKFCGIYSVINCISKFAEIKFNKNHARNIFNNSILLLFRSDNFYTILKYGIELEDIVRIIEYSSNYLNKNFNKKITFKIVSKQTQ